MPIDRTDADSAQSALTTAERILNDRAKLLGMYPEGTRSPDGRLYKGKTGLARLALRDRRAGHSGRDDRNRRGQPAGQQDVAVRSGSGQVRQADGLQPVRGRWRATGSSSARLIDEVMYELMRLGGQEYVDLYAADVKEAKPRRLTAVKPPARMPEAAAG
mgnify:CR=1 FL=1